ncbi:DUF881 domain-containing protein [Streptomyces sp. WMMB 322]|uniref:DUF881 domain-containing protein n=1 Tax=Streptomyces sp. WMMB 322 TaxID=1286821 RepID=UPI000823C92A|nr:DUF881 domain-containing protein [Streptomyces sp. WMMB 322]SCK58546.1 Uncharacterized conserved protein YlxW, UPF0749 family [Streptomyces sp. WMMB 322]
MSGEEGNRFPGELPPEKRAEDRGRNSGPARSERPEGGGARDDAQGSSPGRPERPAGSAGAEAGRSHARGAAESSAGHGSSQDHEGTAKGTPDSSGDKGDKKAGPARERREASSGAAGQAPGGGTGNGSTGRQRLAQAVWPPRVTRAQLIVALLLFVLGLGLAIQVRSTSENSSLRGARQEDLVRILDELDDRSKRLEGEKQSLERQRTELENSSDQAEEARKQTRQKARQLGVLAGTVGAEGPGIELTVTDPGGSVEADMLLDAVQELRAAGAEAIEVNNVRVVANTYFSDSSGGVSVDGHKISPPYRFQVIGKPKDLEPALNIPGGVVQTLRKEQANASVKPSEKIVVNALRSAKRPDYARSSGQ